MSNFATWRAHVVQYDPIRMSVHVILGYEQGGRGFFVTDLGQSVVIEEVPERAVAPTVSIPDGIARALLDAFAQHYGGTGDSRQLRKDYDAERSRVDKLTDAMIAVATTPPMPDTYRVVPHG